MAAQQLPTFSDCTADDVTGCRDMATVAVEKEEGGEQEWLHSAKSGNTDCMFGMYQEVVVRVAPNYMADRIQLPSNLVFEEWEHIVDIPEDSRIVDFLRYGFPTGYVGPVPTPLSTNHPSANGHFQDIAVYITTGLYHGAMQTIFLLPLFQPRCCVNQAQEK